MLTERNMMEYGKVLTKQFKFAIHYLGKIEKIK